MYNQKTNFNKKQGKKSNSLPHYLSFDAVYFEAESYQLLQQPISPVVHEVWSPSEKKIYEYKLSFYIQEKNIFIWFRNLRVFNLFISI